MSKSSLYPEFRRRLRLPTRTSNESDATGPPAELDHTDSSESRNSAMGSPQQPAPKSEKYGADTDKATSAGSQPSRLKSRPDRPFHHKHEIIFDQGHPPQPENASGSDKDRLIDPDADDGSTDTRDQHDHRPPESHQSQDVRDGDSSNDGSTETSETEPAAAEEQEEIEFANEAVAEDDRRSRETAPAPMTVDPRNDHQLRDDPISYPSLDEGFGDVKVITGTDKRLRQHIAQYGSVLHENREKLSKAFRTFQKETSVSWWSRWSTKKSPLNETEEIVSEALEELLSLREWRDLPETHQKRGWWGGHKQTAPTHETLYDIGAAVDQLLDWMKKRQSETLLTSTPIVKLSSELKELNSSLEKAHKNTKT